MTVYVPTSPNVCFCTTVPAKSVQAKCVGIKKNVNKFHPCGSVAPTALILARATAITMSIGSMQQRVYLTLFSNVNELRKRLVKVWSGT